MAKANGGNPNPSPETRFQKGQSGNPGGLSSEQARLIRENAEAASRIRAKLLKATEKALEAQGDDKKVDAMDLIEAAMLKLLTDSETRGLGAPVQQIDNTSSDGSMTPRETQSAVLDALRAKHDPAAG